MDAKKVLWSETGGLITPTYEAIVKTSGPVWTDFKDYPAKMQDALIEAIEGITPKCPPTYERELVALKPGSDPDGFYVKVIVMDRPVFKQ